MFFNLKDEDGTPQSIERREYNIVHWVSRATEGRVNRKPKDFSHCRPGTGILTTETHIKFESVRMALKVVGYFRDKIIFLFDTNGAKLNAWIEIKPLNTMSENLHDKPLHCILAF